MEVSLFYRTYIQVIRRSNDFKGLSLLEVLLMQLPQTDKKQLW